VPSESLFVSALAFGEIRRGVEKLSPGKRRDRVSAWLNTELPDWFEDRVLPIDRAVADEWGRLTAPATLWTLPAVDALIAATARYHRLSVVTRNVDDFADAGVPVINPWLDG
jgi:predicted nucleic acid-binding protein